MSDAIWQKRSCKKSNFRVLFKPFIILHALVGVSTYIGSHVYGVFFLFMAAERHEYLVEVSLGVFLFSVVEIFG